MFDINRQDQPLHTTARLVRSCEAAEMRLGPLISIVLPLARRWPDATASADLLGLSRQALHPARRVVEGLGMHPLAPLHEPISHAGLAARLVLAAEHAARFRARYFLFDTHARTKVWQVLHWRVRATRERNAVDWLEGRDLPAGELNLLAESPANRASPAR
jgi:hypothetical protein